MATGIYLVHAAEWTGLDNGPLLEPLKGASPVSLGAHGELQEVAAALRAAGVTANDFSGEPAKQVIDALRAREGRIGQAVRAYFQAIGLRLAGGYDIADPCAIEMPDILVGNIWASLNAVSHESSKESLQHVRNTVPAQHRAHFDELLEDARRVAPLRDERGIYNEAWSNGIARWGMLEAGRRLAEAGKIADPENALDAMPEELAAIFRGQDGPSSAELEERTRWRHDPANTAPPFLGPPPSPPPPMDGLPPHAAKAMQAVGAAIGEVFGHLPQVSSGISGRAVSSGVYMGTARVVRHPAEFNRLAKGDVLITISTSASFNVVLPLLGAIVTDRGGQLSHAAIVAREYGIPAVVGTLKATTTIPDGARVRVDGSTGRVDVL